MNVGHRKGCPTYLAAWLETVIPAVGRQPFAAIGCRINRRHGMSTYKLCAKHERRGYKPRRAQGAQSTGLVINTYRSANKVVYDHFGVLCDFRLHIDRHRIAETTKAKI